jgi:hypothetical protein
MAKKKFHLGWFMNFTPDEWRETVGQGGSPWDGQFYVEMAQTLERACFDYIMIEDKLMVSETYGGSREAGLRGGVMVPKPGSARRGNGHGNKAPGYHRHHVHARLSAIPAGAA